MRCHRLIFSAKFLQILTIGDCLHSNAWSAPSRRFTLSCASRVTPHFLNKFAWLCFVFAEYFDACPDVAGWFGEEEEEGPEPPQEAQVGVPALVQRPSTEGIHIFQLLWVVVEFAIPKAVGFSYRFLFLCRCAKRIRMPLSQRSVLSWEINGRMSPKMNASRTKTDVKLRRTFTWRCVSVSLSSK